MKKRKLIFIIFIILISIVGINLPKILKDKNVHIFDKTKVENIEKEPSKRVNYKKLYGDKKYIEDIKKDNIPKLKTIGGFVYDTTNNTLNYIYGDDKKILPASLTKLFSIDYALQNISKEDAITVGQEIGLVKPGSSLAYLNVGYELTYEDLIASMLIASGNDASYSLAYNVGKKLLDDENVNVNVGVNTFMESMNSYLKKEGFNDTNLITPDGFADERQYTSVMDMLKISIKNLDYDIVNNFMDKAYLELPIRNGQVLYLKNTNEMMNPASIYYDNRVKGMKTGSLENYYNIIVKVDGKKSSYLMGVFGAKTDKERYEDVVKLINRFVN